MPRLGVITDEISEDFDRVLAVCAELGIHEIELRSVWSTNIVAMDDAQIDHLAAAIDAAGVSVCSIASPFLKCHIDDTEGVAGRMHSATETSRADQWAILDRSLDIADRLGAPLVRTFSFWRLPDPEPARADLLATLTEATARVAARGKLLGLENEHACIIGTGEEAAWYLNRIPDRTLGLIWDPGNEAALGIAPYPGGYEAVKDRIHHIHVKDAARIAEGTPFVKMDAGAIAYEDQFRRLQADGYPGVISIETHYRIDGLAEPATRACIDGTRALASRAGLDLT
ncbi:MAG: sugar phosphate isomerase/epimerase family protein [Thermomicrobiales bacterium]